MLKMFRLKQVISTILLVCCLCANGFAAGFQDLTASPLEEAVTAASEIGILSGYDGNFRPDDLITREEIAKIITLAQGGEAIYDALPFDDVSAERWGYGYIGYCNQHGIMQGVSDTEFQPDAPVTREAFVKMLMDAMGYAVMVGIETTPAAYYSAAVTHLPSLTVRAIPKRTANLTRGEAAELLYTALHLPMLVADDSNGLFIDYVISDGSNGTALVTLYTKYFQ
ncbi:MAG: S-layer homology domain-containing protein [Clostridiales bacterium]|jgi:hypothetical protein|nr:S-layer homology domain-containing protein [Clostridiales bacterium]